jgi:hypothetical protein
MGWCGGRIAEVSSDAQEACLHRDLNGQPANCLNASYYIGTTALKAMTQDMPTDFRLLPFYSAKSQETIPSHLRNHEPIHDDLMTPS